MKSNAYIRIALLGWVCLVLGGNGVAQHNFEFNNDGAAVTIQAGAEVYVHGDVHMNGSSGLLDNDGFIEVQGNMFSDNQFQQRGTGTVRMENNDVNVNDRQFIQGSYAVRGGQAQIGNNDGSFYNLELANTQGVVHLVGVGNVADVRNTVDFQPTAATGNPPQNRIITHDTNSVPANGFNYNATFGMMNPTPGLGSFVNNCITLTGNMAAIDVSYVQGKLRRAIAFGGGSYGYVVGLDPDATSTQSRGIQYILMDFGANNYDVVTSYFERYSSNAMAGTPVECGSNINYFSGPDHGEWMFFDQTGSGTGNYEARIWPQDGTIPTLSTYFITKDNAIQGTANDCGPTMVGLDRAGFNGFGAPSEFAFAGPIVILDENELNISASPRDNQYIQIDWTNLEERNVSKYELERSLDQMVFEPVYDAQASGNDDGAWAYGYSDYDVIQDLNYYYRVRLTDVDGGVTFSNVVSARLNEGDLDNSISVYPIPVNGDGLHLQITAADAGDYELKIYDAIGRLVHEKEFVAEPGVNERIISTSDWAAGAYFMHLRSGTESIVREVIRK